MSEIQIQSQSSVDIRTKAVLIGTGLGALLGASLAFLMARQIEDNDVEIDVGPGSIIAIGLAVLGLMRQLSELARSDE